MVREMENEEEVLVAIAIREKIDGNWDNKALGKQFGKANQQKKQTNQYMINNFGL